MKRIIILSLWCLTSFFCWANSIIFNGSSLEAYLNQEVMFAQNLYVCGRYNHHLYLSYERIRNAEDLVEIGTAAYDSLSLCNKNGLLSAYCPNLDLNSLRLGSTITNLVAIVTGPRNIQINSAQLIASNNVRPTTPPNVGEARLTICTSNLQYYCPAWSGSLGASSSEEFAVQHLKTIKALLNIDADIYALMEIQQGTIALDSLVNGLNARTLQRQYAYVLDQNKETSTYTKVGFIYRTDKVKPVLSLGHPYGPGATIYQNGNHLREYVQAFEELSTQERFILCLNHFKSKSGGNSDNGYYNSERVENATYLVDFLENEIENNYYNDLDILIIGDLNCGSMEEPIRYIESHGYENQLSRFAPNEYSYVFNHQVEYLDHVLASPTMSTQITGVLPYHINADESSTFHYPSGDTSMYRYADHDPILIGLALSSSSNNDCQDISVTETFATHLGCFSAADITGGSYWYNNNTYHCAYINGYSTGENNDWLISPTFDLSNKENAVLQFSHTLGYGHTDTWAQHCQLLISSNYTNSIQNATWEPLSLQMPSGNWSWCNNTIPLPSHFFNQPTVTLAFHYEVSTGDIPAWEIKNLTFTAQCQDNITDTTNIVEYSNNTTPFHAYGYGGQLHFIAEEPTNMVVLDVTGRILETKKRITHWSKSLPIGIYIIKTEKGCKKVFVN